MRPPYKARIPGMEMPLPSPNAQSPVYSTLSWAPRKEPGKSPHIPQHEERVSEQHTQARKDSPVHTVGLQGVRI